MKYSLIGLLLLWTLPYSSQIEILSTEEKEVLSVVEKLFDGMRAGDSTMVRSVFSKEVRMYTNYIDKEGQMHTKEGSLDGFVQAVGTPHDEIWDEKIWNTDIKVEMGVAQVWTEYAFYLGSTFSHCGIDAIQLIKEDDDWNIIQLIDTRKKMNCEKPKE